MIRVREYRSEDYAGLLHILNKVYDSTIKEAVLEGNYINSNRWILLAEKTEDKQIIGCVFIERQTDYVRPSQILYITYLAVDESYRGQGVGKMLMYYVEGVCKELKCSAVEFTSADFRIEAHAFYNKIGYTNKKTTHFIKEIE